MTKRTEQCLCGALTDTAEIEFMERLEKATSK